MTVIGRYFVVCTLGCALALAAGCGGSKSTVGDGGTQGGSGGGSWQGSGGTGSGGSLGQGGTGADGIDAAQGTPDGNIIACGQPGTQCCDGNACAAGGCCVSGICMAQGGVCVGMGGGICNAGVCGNCGGAGLPCCGTNPGACTAAGTVCSAGTCTKCGELGSACCTTTTGAGACNSPKALCSNGVCLACGTPGTACCPGSACDTPGCCYNNVCAAEGTACGTTGGTCQAGRCSGCGSANLPCCSSLCYDGLVCKNGACTTCGGLGQSCCGTGAACQEGMACTTNGSDNVCARCGGLGDICCAGNTCAGGCCSAGRCLAPTSTCPGSQDGGATDAPIGGTGGTGGIMTGSGGAGGMGGTGGTTLPPWTPPAGCGDSVVVFPERCDDGNTVPFDGCSSDCQNEPSCKGSGPCTSRCGDGIVVGEDCDDGNNLDGDGCSSACKVEPGFACAQPALGSRILVPVIYRDFRFHTPTDFEPTVTGQDESSPGIVATELDAEGKPVYTGLTGSGIHIASKDSFASWYRNVEGTNHATASKLALWDNGAGAYVNRYGSDGSRYAVIDTAVWCGTVGSEVKDSNGNPIPCTLQAGTTIIQTDCDKYAAKGMEMLRCVSDARTYKGLFVSEYADGTPVFFPVDQDTFTPASELSSAQIPPLYDGSKSWPYEVDSAGNKPKHNFSFTSEIRYWIKYDASTTSKLYITGDDDVWVFINKKLVLDLGGIHTPVAGSITLDSTTAATLGLVSGNVYEVAVFQAERQTTASTFRITLNGFGTAPSECRRQ